MPCVLGKSKRIICQSEVQVNRQSKESAPWTCMYLFMSAIKKQKYLR